MVSSGTQREVTSEAGPPVEVRVASGGVNDENLVKSMEMEEDEVMMNILESVVTGELAIPKGIA